MRAYRREPEVAYRTLRPLSAFNQAALGQPSKTKVMPSMLPDVLSPAQQVSRVFPFQSFFDSSLLHRAIAVQRQNEPIVYPDEVQIPGYALGLHPSSQTPIAVEFRVNEQRSSSGTIILKPGQFVRPYGIPAGQRRGSFSGFRWGLPFGWLGGGLATLVIFSTDDAFVRWSETTEVIFHRIRFMIKNPGAVATPFPFNWPIRFPWPHAERGGTTPPISQRGSPSIAVTPTRIIHSLRLSSLAAPAVYRMLWQGSNDFGLAPSPIHGNPDEPVTTEAVWDEISWGTYAPTGVPGISEFPIAERTGVFMRLAADEGGVELVSTDPALQGAFVDIVRYGRL